MSKPKSSVVFEEPEDKTPAYDWAAIAVQLRAKPLAWAKVFDHDRTSRVTAIRNQDVAALRTDRGFEIRTRHNTREVDEQGKEVRFCSLYLRYNPQKEKK